MSSELELLFGGKDKQKTTGAEIDLLFPKVKQPAAVVTSAPTTAVPFDIKEEGGLAAAFGLGATPIDLGIGVPKPKEEPLKRTPEDMELSWRQDAPSAMSEFIDDIKNVFVSKSDRAARSAISLTLAEELGVQPHDLEPDLVEAYLVGLSGTPWGMGRQESGVKYPQIPPEAMANLTDSDRLAMGLGGFMGSTPSFALGGLAGGIATGGSPTGIMAGGFMVTDALRSYYTYKMQHGEANNPKEFFAGLADAAKGAGKGAVIGAATGLVGGAVGPLGIPGARLAAEVATMTTIGGAVEGQMPSMQDFVDSLVLLYGVGWMMRAPNALKNVQDLYAKTGLHPKQLINEVRNNPKLAEDLVKDKIPDDVIADAKKGMEEVEAKQAELAAQAVIKQAKKDGTLDEALNKVVSDKAKKAKKIKTSIPNVFKRMPDEELKKQANYGVEGAQQEFELRESDRLTNERTVPQVKGSLIEEAKKYKTAEEFVESLGYHGQGKEHPRYGKETITGGITKTPTTASQYGEGGKVRIVRLSDLTQEQQAKLKGEYGSLTALDYKQEIKPIAEFESGTDIKAQLTDIWNKAHKPVPQQKGEVTKSKPPKLTKSERTELNRAGHPLKVISKMSIEEQRAALEQSRQRPELTTELDMQTGAKTPIELSTEQHPFRDRDPKYTASIKAAYDQQGMDAIRSNPDSMVSKMINEANRWLNGEEVPIDQVREILRTMYANSHEYRHRFGGSEEFNSWKDKVGEASKWVSQAERPVVERGGTQLNMFIPINELPARVKDVMKGIKAVVGGAVQSGKLFRNKELFDKTGFWFGRDFKWRYEIDDSKMQYDYLLFDQMEGQRVKLSDIIDHPELYKDIPELKDVNIKLNPKIKPGGVYHSVSRQIEVSSLAEDTIIHELQHAVNDIVGSKFKGSNVEVEQKRITIDTLTSMLEKAKTPSLRNEIASIIVETNQGWEPKDAYDLSQRLLGKGDKENLPPEDFNVVSKGIDKIMQQSGHEAYMKDPGEMEARLASRRMNMTAEERKSTPPWETLDDMLTGEGLDKLSVVNKRFEKPFGEVRQEARSVGQKLYDITGATGEAAKQVIKAARGVADYMKRARGAKAFKPGIAIKMGRDSFVRAVIEKSGNVRRELLEGLGDEGYRIVQKMYLTKGAPSIAIDSLEQMGKEVYSGLNKGKRNILDTIILSSRMVDLAKYKTEAQLAIPEGKKFADFASYLRTFKFKEINGIRDLTDKEAFDMYHVKEDGTVGGRAGAYFDWMRKPLKDMLDSQLITQKEYDALSSHNYRRTKLVELYDNKYSVNIGKKSRTIYDSGVDPLARGRDTDIYEPSSEVLALEVFNRAYGRVLNNEANLNLLKLAKDDNTNPFVRVKGEGESIPSGWQRFFVFEEGKRKAIYLSPDMSKEWIVNSPDISYKLSQIIRYASGAPMLRMFATGINWGFAVANLPRDIQHIWYAARVFEDGKWKSLYNPLAPVYVGQMGKDMVDVFSDVALRRGELHDYIKEGGGMEFLTLQGRVLQRGRHVGGPLDKLLKGLGYLGESSELLTRMAIRRRVIKRRAKERGISYEEMYKDKDVRTEATFAARDYMDFGQGGWLSKAADNGLPYLNAGIVGTRGMLRAFKPGSGTAAVSTFKLAQYAGIVSSLYIASKHFNPKTMEALEGSQSSVTNMTIPLGDQFSFVDDKGQTRYIYLKVPIDPGQRFFKTFFEAATDKWLGNEVDVDRVTDSLKQSIPFEVDQLPPTSSAVLGYMANKDFWYQEDIWKKTDPLSYPKSKEEYIPGQTGKMFEDIGALTGMSPERLKFAIGELTAGDNLWTNLIGKSYEAIYGDLPKSNKEMHIAQILAQTPILKRMIGITNPYTKWSKPIDEARETAQLERWIQNRGMDQLVEGYLFQENVTKKEIADYMKSFKDLKVYDRMQKDFEFQVVTKDLDNRSFWLGLKRIPDTEGRARVYAERWNTASPTEKDQIRSEFETVRLAGGVISSDFLDEAAKLIK